MLSYSLLSGEGDVGLSARGLCSNTRPHGLGIKQVLLHDRIQRITALGANSQALPVTSGVPQGSILGPMLFLLYANSLSDNVKSSHVATFADDTEVFKPIKSPTDFAMLQNNLSSLATWSSSAGL